MDKGPFRGQGQDSKAQPARTPVHQPQVDKVVAEDMPRTEYSRKSHVEQAPPKSNKRLIIGIGLFVAVALLCLVAWFVWQSTRSSSAGIDSSKYQMVKLSDGQSYYGKLSALDSEHMKLADVFYLENEATSANESDTTSTKDDQANQNKYKLLKFTGIYFGPEDEMTISRSQIINYANLDPEGKIVRIIEQYKSSNK